VFTPRRRDYFESIATERNRAMAKKATRKSTPSRRAGAKSSKRPAGKSRAAKRASRSARAGRSSSTRKTSKATGRKTAKTTTRRKTAAPKAARAKSSTSARGGKKVGGNREAARSVGGALDFGVSPRRREEALDVSRRTRGDTATARAGTDSRVAGVGGRESGPGSHSGGDLDPSITGVGTGGSAISQAGPDEPGEMGAAETTGGSEQFASGPPAQGRNQLPPDQIGGGPPVRGSTVDRGEASTLSPDAEGSEFGERSQRG
jgi:hypothetical protein